jgi:phage-related minor tail protein
MAVTVASLEAVLNLSKKGFDKGIKSAGAGMKKLALAGGKVLGAGVAAGAAAGVAAIGAVGAAAFSVANDIDSAQAEIAASLGTSKEAAGEFRDEMKSIFAAGVGDDFSQIGEAIATVKKSIDGIDDAALKDVAQGGLSIGKAFDKDINETVDATAVLMKEMGLTGQQAMDFIAKGLQSGLDRNGDFLDSIREYGNLFGDAGFDAAQFFSIMESGAAGGVLGTDKISDAVKELGIRANESGKAFEDAIGGIGLDFSQISSQVASGEAQWADFFGQITSGLQGIEDPIERARLQTAIFGTQAEDLGVSFTEGLSDATTTLEDMAGATEKVNAQYDTLGGALEGIKRKGMVALEPLGKGMLTALNNVMPKVTAFFDDVLGPAIARFGEGAGPIFEDFVNKLTSTVGPAMELISDALKRINIAFGGTGEGVDAVNTALGILEGILNAVIFGIQAAALAFQGIAWAVEQVGAAIDIVTGQFDLTKQVIAGLGNALPDWLKPGSPPPLAVGLGNIADQLKAMPDMAGVFGAGNQTATATPAMAAATPVMPAGAGGGGVTVIVQGSINGDAHLKSVVMESFDMLNMALAGGT